MRCAEQLLEAISKIQTHYHGVIATTVSSILTFHDTTRHRTSADKSLAVHAVVVWGDPSHVAGESYDKGTSEHDGVSIASVAGSALVTSI